MADHHPAPPSAHPPQPAPVPRPAAPRAAVPKVHSAQLFGDAQEVEIVHGRDVYRLRITSLGRLILTK